MVSPPRSQEKRWLTLPHFPLYCNYSFSKLRIVCIVLLRTFGKAAWLPSQIVEEPVSKSEAHKLLGDQTAGRRTCEHMAAMTS